MRLHFREIALSSLLLAGLSQQAEAAQDLQYDAAGQQRQRMFNEMLMDAQACMHDAVRTRLQQGARDSTEIIDFAQMVCSGVIVANSAVFMPSVPKTEVQEMMRAMATRELNSVPGLSRKPTEPQSAPSLSRRTTVAGSVPYAPPTAPRHRQINWNEKQVTLKGVVHKGVFDDCCYQGASQKSAYYYLTLKEKVDIVDRDGEDELIPNLDAIQLGGKLNATKEGQSVTVVCKEIVYGASGHYAMPAYCDDAKITR